MNLFKELPKVNLHQHLEGAVRPATFLELVQEHNLNLPITNLKDSKQYLQVSGKETNLADFLDKIHHIFAVSHFTGVLKRFAFEAVEDAYFENVQYLEIRFGPWQHAKGRSVNEPIEQVLAGIQDAMSKYPIKVGLIVCALRDDKDPRKNMELVEAAAKYVSQGVVGFDIAGDEEKHPASNFKSIFSKAKDSGLGITVHAGEVGEGRLVVDAIKQLYATRIGHGVQIASEPKIIEQVKTAGVTLEICPTSNIHTRAIESYADHPIRKLYDLGVSISLGDDDPTTSGITISSEYQLLKEKFNFTSHELVGLVLNGAQAAFLPQKEKQALVQRLKPALKAWQVEAGF